MRRFWKTWMALMATVALLLGMCPTVGVSAAKAGDFWYTVLTDGTAKITVYVGSATDLTVPETLGGYTVTAIGYEAFYDCDSLQSVMLPASLTAIGDRAFPGCSSLQSIVLPDGVTTIGDRAFSGCSSLQSLTLPASLTAIGNYAFAGCSLQSLTLPASLTAIGELAFASCSSLQSIVLPDGVTTIGDEAFYGCTSLQSIALPASLTTIGEGAFSGCDSLHTVCYSGTALQRWGISIGSYNSYYLTNATWYYNAVGAGQSGDFSYAVLTDGTAEITDYTGSATDLTVPETIDGYTVTTIGDYAFKDCSSLQSLTLPTSLTVIGELAFCLCTSLQSIALPDGVTSIGKGAFAYCDSLQSVMLPDGVTVIGECAFEDCSSLQSVMLPASVTAIGNSAFLNCDSLQTVYYGGTESEREEIRIGSGNSSLTNATWYYNVVGIRQSGDFEYVAYTDGTAKITGYNGSATELTVPATLDGYAVTAIGDGAFEDVTALREVFYGGTKAQWKSLPIGSDNEALTAAYIHYNTTEDHCTLAEVVYESCTSAGEGVFTCDCGHSIRRPLPAKGHTEEVVQVVAATCSESGYTIYRCTTCYETYCGSYTDATGHTFEKNRCVGCGEEVSACIASKHNYENNGDDTWTIVQPHARAVSITFAAETETEEDCDFLSIYDGDGNLVGTYTGTALAGQTVTVAGDTVKIRLTTDDSIVGYGFAVTAVAAEWDYALGDADLDGELTTLDVLALFNIVGGSVSATDAQRAVADFDGDGDVNTLDVLALFNKIAGIA